jgi:hypothetical protein
MRAAVVSRSVGRRAGDGGKHWRFVVENGLSLTMLLLFVAFTLGQIVTGYRVHNDELMEHGRMPIALSPYLSSGHFIEAFFENWESEFFQMGAFVLLTVKLRQKGSSEAKDAGEAQEQDEDPRRHRHRQNAPWPVKRGGIWLKLYEHSLSIALFTLFLFSFAMHAVGGRLNVNEEHLLHGEPSETLAQYVSSSQFWYESFQNWQSEFFAVFAIVVLSIFLRQRGSPQSKPVASPHAETGG